MSIEQTVNDEFTRLAMVKTKHKIKFISVNVIDGECKIICLLQNNQLEVYSRQLNNNTNDEASLTSTVQVNGHRTDVRTISFSSDSTAFISASGDSLKVWNRMSLNCIRTFACDYALCSLFLSDDNHVLIGTKV